MSTILVVVLQKITSTSLATATYWNNIIQANCSPGGEPFPGIPFQVLRSILLDFLADQNFYQLLRSLDKDNWSA